MRSIASQRDGAGSEAARSALAAPPWDGAENLHGNAVGTERAISAGTSMDVGPPFSR
jgi:hypothetical protein